MLVTSAVSVRAALPDPIEIKSGWQMQEIGKVTHPASEISSLDFYPKGWYDATVPGTVLTTLVNNNVFPEPLYGENNRPDKIPETLCHTSYWYRTIVRVPKAYAGKRTWLNFDGINYSAEVWVNGRNVGTIRGAFTRGTFDISSVVTAGQDAVLAVLVSPQPNPGIPHEHTLRNGMGGNGGLSAIDGPTFLCSMGWDWIPAIRDRNTGIWQKVFLSATGPVEIKDPLVTSEISLPNLHVADVSIQVTVTNLTASIEKGVLKGDFGETAFEKNVELEPNECKTISLNAGNTPVLRVKNPKLWWPNGFGPQNLYTLHLSFEDVDGTSDRRDVDFGIRKITYSVPNSENLTISVNGVPVFCKGGNWGMDEAMKRIPYERLDAEMRMHQIANFTMIRNWVGQSTSADFYDLCDKYGILVWDEFFQPNPGDGPNPTDLATYIANVREKILRFRNHPCIAVWCGRNEGRPPADIDTELRKLMAQLEPTRLYQPSSTDGRGVRSGGPYSWRPPREFYDFNEPFKTELGSMSIPTLESIHGMMPQNDWETINDDWAEHDMANGASGGENYRNIIEDRYGKISNLADFVRKAQMANYEAYRAMYEGRSARLFHPSTAVITWMSNPAQPSFVWQLYHHDLEPNASLFGARKGCEPVHIMLNERRWNLEVINNLPTALSGARARVALYNLDGSIPYQTNINVNARPGAATDLGAIDWPANLSSVHFVKLELRDAKGKLVSDNFYWRALPRQQDDLRDLEKLPTVKLDARVDRHDSGGKCLLSVTLHNPTAQVAVMAHLQLHREHSGDRVLSVFYTDNYISLVPGESKTVTVEAALADLKGEKPLVVLDGWNIDVAPIISSTASIALNTDAQVSHWPVTGLPICYGPPLDEVHISCGGSGEGIFKADMSYNGGAAVVSGDTVDTSALMAGPATIYQSERWGDMSYRFSMARLPAGYSYTVRLHFAETKFNSSGQRVFNVDINGQKVLTDFDIVEAAGGKDKAVIKEFAGVLPDSSNNIFIQFRRGRADEAKICAIEIIRRADPNAVSTERRGTPAADAAAVQAASK